MIDRVVIGGLAGVVDLGDLMMVFLIELLEKRGDR